MLLREPPSPGMTISQYVSEVTLKKAMCLNTFLVFMHKRDQDLSHFETGGKLAIELAEEAGEISCVSASFVYRDYKEWRQGQLQRDKQLTEDGQNSETFEEGLGWFLVDRRGSYARRFLMDEEDLKIKFKKWMRSNLRKLSVDLAWEYLNTKLLKKISEDTLLAHRISLPISRDTSWQWMKKCDATRMGSQKTYYNDHHENPEVIVYRGNYIKTKKKLQMRMQVWRIISDQEEEKYKTMR